MMRITIDLDAGPDRPMQGHITGPDGTTTTFHGTLELVAHLERLARPLPAAADPTGAGRDVDRHA